MKKQIDAETGIRKAVLRKRKREERIAERRNLKKPAPGERKALRKRIVLSNTNAFEVPGLTELKASTDLADPYIMGNIVALPGDVIDQLRVVDAFKPSQGWGMFRKPATLVRKEMQEIVRIMDDAVSRKGIERKVIVGEKSSGKSVLLLQAMAVAFLKKWVVINLPNCELPYTAPISQYCANVIIFVAQKVKISHSVGQNLFQFLVHHPYSTRNRHFLLSCSTKSLLLTRPFCLNSP